MERTAGSWNTLRRQTVLQGKITLLGLAVVLVPVVVLVKSIEHAHKLVSNAVVAVSPGIQMVGGIGLAAIILLALFVACWFVGWLVTRTDTGSRFMDWEGSKLLARSPLALQKEVKKVSSMQAGAAAPAPTREAQPALAHVGGGWQPGAIVEESTEGWATVFLPNIPSVATGRLVLVSEDQLLRLDVPLDAYRKKLTASGHDSADWLKALSDTKPDQ